VKKVSTNTLIIRFDKVTPTPSSIGSTRSPKPSSPSSSLKTWQPSTDPSRPGYSRFSNPIVRNTNCLTFFSIYSISACESLFPAIEPSQYFAVLRALSNFLWSSSIGSPSLYSHNPPWTVNFVREHSIHSRFPARHCRYICIYIHLGEEYETMLFRAST